MTQPIPRRTFALDTSYGRYVWDVDAALALVQAQPRPAFLVSPALRQQTLAKARVQAAGVAQADPRQPGLVGVYWDIRTARWEWVIVDGNHRLHKAYQTGFPFRCYELNPGESWRVLLAYPAAVEAAVYTKHLDCQGNCLRTKSPSAPPPPYVRTFRRAPVPPARGPRAQGRRRR